jgi:hypothetical protein
MAHASLSSDNGKGKYLNKSGSFASCGDILKPAKAPKKSLKENRVKGRRSAF